MSVKIGVASGKGGTGKTTVAVGLALALNAKGESLQFLDCDVEEPNAGLLLKPALETTRPVTLQIPRVDKDKCTGCGKCREICQYNAVAVVKEKALVFEDLCHACGGCRLACPEGAITEEEKVIGKIEAGIRGNIVFRRGVLNVGEPMATPIVRMLKSDADPEMLTILDAPPGTACPVIATVKDCDYCLLVTEPTPFGLYDLDLMVKVVRELGVPAGIVINKDDAWSRNIEEYARQNDLGILLRIPFSRDIAELYSKGIPLNDAGDSWNEKLYRLSERVRGEICQSPSR